MPWFFLTQEVAKQAIELVMPAIKAMMSSGQTERMHLHIVVMDPAGVMAKNPIPLGFD